MFHPHDSLRVTARRTGDVLTEAAIDLISSFLVSRFNPDGGCRGRSTASDLYYTMFAEDALWALDCAPPEALGSYLDGFSRDPPRDFVHAICLIRCLSCGRATPTPAGDFHELLELVEDGRTPDGGYHPNSSSVHGRISTSYLAMLAYDACGKRPPASGECLDFIDSLLLEDGGFSDERGGRRGSVPATAAAVVIAFFLGETVPAGALNWLLTCLDAGGGFRANQGALFADLLSTAVALYALRLGQADLSGFRDSCLEFVRSLWDTERGGFRACEADDVLDSEYTFYGLLALGVLSG